MSHHRSVSKLRWGRGFGVALLFVVLAAGAAVLGVFLSKRGLDWAAKFSEIAAFVLAGLAFVLPAAGKIVRWLPAPRIKDEQVEHDVADLAAALRAQWRFEGVQPGGNVYDRLPMPVRWEPAEEVMSGIWAGILGFKAADSEEGMTGTFDEVLEFFRQLPEPRLVVLGEAGAGKTVLAMELARRLLAARKTAIPSRSLFRQRRGILGRQRSSTGFPGS
jgi:hypothetical protein